MCWLYDSKYSPFYRKLARLVEVPSAKTTKFNAIYGYLRHWQAFSLNFGGKTHFWLHFVDDFDLPLAFEAGLLCKRKMGTTVSSERHFARQNALDVCHLPSRGRSGRHQLTVSQHEHRLVIVVRRTLSGFRNSKNNMRQHFVFRNNFIHSVFRQPTITMILIQLMRRRSGRL